MTAEDTLDLPKTLEFIRNYIERGDIKRIAKKHDINYSMACGMVKGRYRPRFEFLSDLRMIAVKNHSRIAIKK